MMDRSRRVRVSVISGHQLILDELKRFLSDDGFGVRTVKLNASITDVPIQTFPNTRVCVVDGNAPTKVVEAITTALVNARPKIGIVALQDKFTDSMSFSLLRLGAKGLVTYKMMRAHLPPALRMVAAGGYWVPRQVLSRFVGEVLNQRNRRPSSNLLMSLREREVLTRLMNNFSNKEIASSLNITERTVKFHVSNLLAKFGVRRRADLIVLAYQNSEALPSGQNSTEIQKRR